MLITSGPSDSGFTPRETHCGVVRRLICSLQVNKATGLDGISVRLLKEAGPGIVPSLSPILSIYPLEVGAFQTNGKFPKYCLCIRRILSLILTTIDPYLFYQLLVK